MRDVPDAFEHLEAGVRQPSRERAPGGGVDDAIAGAVNDEGGGGDRLEGRRHLLAFLRIDPAPEEALLVLPPGEALVAEVAGDRPRDLARLRDDETDEALEVKL